MNPLNFVAVILKVLLVNLLAALNFANVFKNKKRSEYKKTLKNIKNVTKIKKRKKTFFTSMAPPTPPPSIVRYTHRPSGHQRSCWKRLAIRPTRGYSSRPLTNADRVASAI